MLDYYILNIYNKVSGEYISANIQYRRLISIEPKLFLRSKSTVTHKNKILSVRSVINGLLVENKLMVFSVPTITNYESCIVKFFEIYKIKYYMSKPDDRRYSLKRRR